VDALLASVDHAAGRARESHAPEEAKIAFYERLGDLARQAPASARGSGTSLTGQRRGAA
jgi:hypothetical protein